MKDGSVLDKYNQFLHHASDKIIESRHESGSSTLKNSEAYLEYSQTSTVELFCKSC